MVATPLYSICDLLLSLFYNVIVYLPSVKRLGLNFVTYFLESSAVSGLGNICKLV